MARKGNKKQNKKQYDIDVDFKTANKKLEFLYSKKAKKYQHIVYYSGRGAGKSYGVVDYLLYEALKNPVTIVVIRNTKVTVWQSVWKLFRNRIRTLGLQEKFHQTRDEITCYDSGSEIRLFGSNAEPEDFKGIPDIDFVFFEEATQNTDHSFNVILPTCYRGGAHYKRTRIIICFNPEYDTDAVYERFILPITQPICPRTGRKRLLPHDTIVFRTHWTENTLRHPDTAKAAYNDMLRDPDYASWAWDGELKRASQEMVFLKGKHWLEGDLDHKITHDMYPYIGADFGTNSPTCAIVAYVSPNQKEIYIQDEVYKDDIGVDEIPALFDKLQAIRRGYKIIGDSAAEWAIRYLKQRNYNIVGCNKGGSRGSIAPGIQFLRGKFIRVNPRCINTIHELRNHRFAIEKSTKEIKMDVFEDKYNHLIDSLRYALEPLIMLKARGTKAQYQQIDKSITPGIV